MVVADPENSKDAKGHAVARQLSDLVNLFTAVKFQGFAEAATSGEQTCTTMVTTGLKSDPKS